MDHREAAELYTVERYLLDELRPEERDEFEEHFFDCQECALDLRATASFMDAARREFALHPLAKAAPVEKDRSRWRSLRPALAWSALAACLLVMVYQNTVVYPRFRAEIAELKAPEILPALSLVGGNSRGGQVPELTIGAAQPFLLSLDIPTQDRFSSYSCLLYSPGGSLFWRVQVSAQMAKDTVSIRVPSPGKLPGEYTLVVQGNGNGTAVDLGRYRFALNNPN